MCRIENAVNFYGYFCAQSSRSIYSMRSQKRLDSDHLIQSFGTDSGWNEMAQIVKKPARAGFER